jgi:hypothetical protein
VSRIGDADNDVLRLFEAFRLDYDYVDRIANVADSTPYRGMVLVERWEPFASKGIKELAPQTGLERMTFWLTAVPGYTNPDRRQTELV